jgi:cell division cycle protein 20 (cofactor of APC complex)
MQIWDVGRMKQIRALKGHSARVSALAWSGTTLSSGGRDSNIINHDVRCGDPFLYSVLQGPA